MYFLYSVYLWIKLSASNNPISQKIYQPQHNHQKKKELGNEKKQQTKLR